MATVKGVWLFNETITKIPVSENVNFSVTLSDGSIVNYDRMFISGNDLGYKRAGQSGVTCAYYHSLSPNRWTNEIWRTVDFGTTSQTVSDEFYAWLTENAAPFKVIQLSPCKMAINLLPGGSGSRLALVK